MKKVLIFRTGQLGDTLVAVPSIRLVLQTYPDAQMDYLYDVHPGKGYITGRQVLEGGLSIREFIPYEVNNGGIRDKIQAYRRLLGRIRKTRYDLLVNLVQPPRTAKQLIRDRIFFRLAGIRKQIVAAPAESRGLASMTRPLASIAHEADFLLQRLHESGLPEIAAGDGNIQLASTSEEASRADQWLASSVDPSAKGLVAVAAGSKMQAKQWPIDSFVRVLGRLWEDEKIWPVLLGGPSDADIGQSMVEDIGAGAVAAGTFDIRGSLALLQRCDFYVGNDTGTMHLAVAAGLKCVAIFSARDQPGRWYPYGEGHVVHRLAVECEGCMLQECITEKKRCLTEIQPEDVLTSCISIWERLHKQVRV